jgi:hypothetical protein
VSSSARRAEVIRVFERYLTEVVERYDFCPWARLSREGGELAVDVVWGTPTVETWVTACQQLLARPETRVAMVIAPELEIEPNALHGLRAEVAAGVPSAGVADFHPDATLDLATPARLVPFIRRSPDPLLQLVPFALLDQVRAAQQSARLAEQAQILGGRATPPRPDAAARIAAANHATVSAAPMEVARALDAIAADRASSYARVGITSSR